ncbi:MAG TPA: hypothetical protein VIH35_07035 [Kiritimatiellia bacterium]
MTWVVGLAWAFILSQWLDLLRQLVSIKASVIPADLNLGDRAAVTKHIESLSGGSILATRVRALLTGWSQGWLPSEVVDLAAAQAARDSNRLRAAALFVLLVFAAAVARSDQAELAWTGIAALGATLFALGLVHARIDSFIEKNLLTRLPAHLPGTAMTAAELAQSLGGAINEAFKNHVPQPDKMAAAVTGAVDNFRKATVETLETVHKKLAESQTALLQKWTDQEKQTAAGLDTARKALESLTAAFAASQSTGAEKMDKALTHHVQQLEKATGVEKLQAALTHHVQQLEKATTGANEKASSAMASHADNLAKASQAIASQLDKIMSLEKDIQKVLHIQQLVDGTMKSVTAAEEFKQTLTTLRTHIEASDKLLRELSKPRHIRLIETETEPKQAAAPTKR